jgi:hypothetical protein
LEALGGWATAMCKFETVMSAFLGKAISGEANFPLPP